MVNILIADDNIYYAKTLMNIINDNDSNIKVTHIAVDGKIKYIYLFTLELKEKKK